VTNSTLAKALCATCLLACVVQVWSTETVADSGVKDGREAWTEGPGGQVASRAG
jgi:hypothetical protein